MDENLNKYIKIKLAILQIFYWCTFGAFTAYAVSFFKFSGLSTTAVGICASIYALGAFFGQIILNGLSDKLKTNKKIFISGMILTIILYFAIYFSPKEILVVLTLYGLLGFIQGPTLTSIDTWILKTYHKTPEIYGPIRSSASLVYAIFMLFYGGLIKSNGYIVTLYVSVIFAGVTLIVAFLTPDAPQLKKTKEKLSLAPLFSNKSFIFVLFVAFMLGVSSAPFMNMIAIIMGEVGGDVSKQGTALFVSAIFQVPSMMLAPKLSKYSIYKRLGVAAILYFFGATITAFAPSSNYIILASAFNGIAFGTALPTIKQAVFENSPKNLHTTAQGLAEAFHTSVAAILSTLLSGIIIQNFGLKTFMLGCASIEVILIVVLYVKFMLDKKTRS